MIRGTTDHAPKPKSDFSREEFVDRLEQKVTALTLERNRINGRTTAEIEQRIALDARIHDYKLWIKEFSE